MFEADLNSVCSYLPVEIRVGIFEVCEEGDSRSRNVSRSVSTYIKEAVSYPHSNVGSSDMSIFLNLLSLKAL